MNYTYTERDGVNCLSESYMMIISPVSSLLIIMITILVTKSIVTAYLVAIVFIRYLIIIDFMSS